MQVKINKNNVNLQLNDLANASLSFSLFQGRKFTITPADGSSIFTVSLKALQKAINKGQKESLKELKDFRDQLKTMRHKGYRKSTGNDIKKANILTQWVVRLMHLFSKKTYNTLMTKLNHSMTQETLDHWNTEFDRIVDIHTKAKTNSTKDLRRHRIALYQETKERARSGYFLEDKFIQLDPNITKSMVEGTKRLENKKLKPSLLPNPAYHTFYEFVDEDTLDLAESYIRKGLNPAVLNLANPYIPGGDVENGSGAQEESIFRRSNYHEALYPQENKLYPINKAQAIYTPYVQIFRTAEKNLTKTNQPNSYQYREPFTVDLIACAAINLSEGDKPDDYEELMRAKIRLILAIAVEKGHDSLVLGALGCGAFKNDPKQVSHYFKEALESDEFKGRFKRVGFGIILSPKLLTTFKNLFKI